MAEGARLESVYTFTRIGGSNPSLSANLRTAIAVPLVCFASRYRETIYLKSSGGVAESG